MCHVLERCGDKAPYGHMYIQLIQCTCAFVIQRPLAFFCVRPAPEF